VRRKFAWNSEKATSGRKIGRKKDIKKENTAMNVRKGVGKNYGGKSVFGVMRVPEKENIRNQSTHLRNKKVHKRLGQGSKLTSGGWGNRG